MGNMTRSRQSTAISERKDAKPSSPMARLRKNLNERSERMAQEMTDKINVDSQIGAVLSLANANAGLLKCHPDSIISAVYEACRLGLHLHPSMKQAYLVPFKGRAQLIIDFRGLIYRAIKSGMIRSAKVKLIYKNDHFRERTVLLGGQDQSILEHEYALGEDRGDIIGGYSMFKLPNGDTTHRVMPIERVKAIRRAAPSARSNRDTPWDTHPEEMISKTILKWGLKLIPMSLDVADLVAADDRSEKRFTEVAVAPLEEVKPPIAELEVDESPLVEDSSPDSAEAETPGDDVVDDRNHLYVSDLERMADEI